MSVQLPSSYTESDRTALEELGISEVLSELENYDPSAEHVADASDMLCYLLENGVLPSLVDPDLAADANFINTVEDLRQLNLVGAEDDSTIASLVVALESFLSDSGNPVDVYSDAQDFIDDWNARNPEYSTEGSGDAAADGDAETSTLTADDVVSYFMKSGNLALAVLFLLQGGDVEDEDGKTTHKEGLFTTINDGMENALDDYQDVVDDIQEQNDLIADLDMTDEQSQVDMKLADTQLSNDKTATDLLSNMMKTLDGISNTLLQFAADVVQTKDSLNSRIISS